VQQSPWSRGRAVAGLQLEERVGVDDDRQLHLGEHTLHELLRPGPATEPRPDRDGARLLRELDDCVGCTLGDHAVVVGQRPLHGFEQALLEHRQR
jgi:hypothetical protein